MKWDNVINKKKNAKYEGRVRAWTNSKQWESIKGVGVKVMKKRVIGAWRVNRHKHPLDFFFFTGGGSETVGGSNFPVLEHERGDRWYHGQAGTPGAATQPPADTPILSNQP